MALSDEDKQWIREEMRGLREEMQGLRDEIERVETSLLTEFHKWASPLEARQRTHAAAIRALDQEMNICKTA